MRALLLLAALVAASAQNGCEQARSDCAASCAGDSLDVAAFLCRETVFGLLTSCSCAPAKAPAGPSSSEVFVGDSDSSVSSSDYGFSSTSSSEPSSSSSSSSDVAFVPRRFGPMLFPANLVQQPMFFPAQQPQQADPFAAARTAFLNDVLARSGRQSQPSLVLNFETQQPAEGMLFIVREEQPDSEPRHEHGHHEHHGHDDDSDDMDEMGAGCAIMTLATVGFFVGLVACCVRACLAACPRRATVARRTHQILVDSTVGELSSPLLVVEDTEKDMVTVVSRVA